MNIRLQNLLLEAETRLDQRLQERLGDLVEAFVETATTGEAFTPKELEQLKQLETAPFEAASPGSVAAVFSRRA
jgi:erythromycin esterase-like protein